MPSKPDKPKHVRGFHHVLAAEHHAINARRTRLGRPPIKGVPPELAENAPEEIPDDDEDERVRKVYVASQVFDTVGLSFSGGGIRSAAICLGAAQALADKGLFDNIDYLSTVSGGGYAGTAISTGMSETGDFPFRDKGDRSDPPALGHIRNFSNYLIPTGFWDVMWNISIYLRGIVTNILFISPVLLLLAAFTLFVNPTYVSLLKPGYEGADWFNSLLLFDGAFGVTLSAAAVVGIVFVGWSMVRAFQEGKPEFSGYTYRFCGIGLVVIAVFAFCELQPFIVRWMPDSGAATASQAGGGLVELLRGVVKNFGVWLAPIVAAVSFASKYLGDALKTEKTEKTWKAWVARLASKAVIWVAALALPLLLWFVYLNLVYWGVMPDTGIEPNRAPAIVANAVGIVDLFGIHGHPKYAIAYTVIGILMLGLLLLQTPNANSLHRLYRDRLSKAFAFVMQGDVADPRDKMRVSEIDVRNAPYHIYNAALNIHGSKTVNQRGRNAEFFHFGPRYSGSELTGYVRTPALESVDPGLNIATTMAVSGAAVSSNMGAESIRPLSPTLALMNFRLGYWTRNPLEVTAKFVTPKIFYLVSEVLGKLNEKSTHIYLTDGGHIENLGLYELLRRRCRIIIAVDAEADPEMNFPAFVKLQRYARIDLGIRITLKWDQIRAVSHEMQTGKAKPASGPHCAIGRIDYSETVSGVLIYVKSSVSGDENDYIADYNRRFEPFPHETTGDQFFSEEQFEVYRALGFHMMKGLFMGDQNVQTIDEGLQMMKPWAKGFGVEETLRLLGLTSAAPQAAKPQSPRKPKSTTRK